MKNSVSIFHTLDAPECTTWPAYPTDEGIPTSLPSFVDDIASRVDVQHKPDDLRTRPITRARAKLLEQQVNSLLTKYNLFTNENFILPKSLHVV
jgi:hypothetical protein